jgi:type II secretory pathway pseudopilin PulG
MRERRAFGPASFAFWTNLRCSAFLLQRSSRDADEKDMGDVRVRAEEGYTVVELLVVVLILGFVMAAVLATGTATQKLAVRGNEASLAVRDAQSAVYRITRELRQATLINPTGTVAGTCPATATASCVDFLVRTQAFDAADNHVLQRVRIDCTQPYVGKTPRPSDAQYRSCVRYVSANTAVPAIVRTGVVIERVRNWASSTWPIFAYRRVDPAQTSANGWITASPSTNTTSSNAERINVTLQVPARGEAEVLGASRNLLVQDAAQLRNLGPS